MSNIFLDNAPKYWERNLPVIPLRTMEKMPSIARWQTYSDVMPTAEEQDIWLKAFPTGNMGIVLGPVAGMTAIDVDNDDDGRIVKALEKVIPVSPWVRIGNKGFIMGYRWNGQRTFKIQDSSTGKNLVECLSKGSQIVLPPSIHPATQKAYWASADLLDVWSTLPDLPKDLEKTLREALGDAGFKIGSSGNTTVTTFVPAGARDNSMVGMAGMLAKAVTRAERSLLEALQMMQAWVENYVQKVAGDELSIEKAQGKVIEFLIRDVTGEKQLQLPIGWDDGLTAEDKERLGLSFTSNNEIWSYERIKEFLLAEFANHPERCSPPWMTAVEVALSKVARNTEISSIDEDRLLKFIVEQSAKQISMGSLRKRVHEFRKSEREGTDHSEIAGYVIKDFSQFGELRFEADRFWQWKGASWARVDESEFRKLIAEEYGHYPAAKKYSDHNGIVKVMGSLMRLPLKKVEIKGLNFANGFLNEKLELLPHNPDFGCQYVLPYRYLPERAGHCPQFMQYLQDCWGKDPDFVDKIDALQEIMAATMFGIGTAYQRCVCLYGEGNTGKTRLIEIMKGLLPNDCSSSVAPHDMEDKFLPTELFGRLLNVAGELSESRLIAGDMFKKIVEGMEINGQYKNGQVFQFKPMATHWFASNHLPKTRDTSNGFTRRWLFLKFNHPVAQEKKVIDLDRVILAAEREEIAAWAALGVERLRRNQGYTLPTSHMVLEDQVANDANSVRYFLANCHDVKVGDGGSVSEARLFQLYHNFCLTTQVARPMMQRNFHKLMQGLNNTFKFKQVIVQQDGHDLVQYENIKAVKP